MDSKVAKTLHAHSLFLQYFITKNVEVPSREKKLYSKIYPNKIPAPILNLSKDFLMENKNYAPSKIIKNDGSGERKRLHLLNRREIQFSLIESKQ